MGELNPGISGLEKCPGFRDPGINSLQEMTTKKSQKRNISHIWGQAPHKAIAMKFGTGVDVHEVDAWAEFDL